MNNTDLLIHVGYQKTGTTWLQKHLFSNQMVGFAQPFSALELNERVVFPFPLSFDVSTCRSTLLPSIEQVRKNGLFPVLSRERFSGAPRGGGYDSKELAERLVQLFPKAKILIVIREQRAMVSSIYKQIVKGNACLSLEQFLTLSTRRKKRRHLFDLERFEYHRLISYYQQLFSKENVLVLPYELLCQNPTAYVEKISEFCGLAVSEQASAQLPYQRKENQGVSANATAMQRWLNYFFVPDLEENPVVLSPIKVGTKHAQWLARRINRITPTVVKQRIEKKHEAQIAAYVGDYYRQSNAETVQLTGLELKAYGYDFP